MKPEDTDRERHLFHFLMENIPDRIYFKDRESRFICVNAAMARLFHLKGPDEAVGKIDYDFSRTPMRSGCLRTSSAS